MTLPQAVGDPERVVARNFLALGAGEVVARVIAFLAAVYAARVLGASAYGIVNFAMMVMLYVAFLAGFGVDVVGAQLVARNRSRVPRLVASLLLARLILAAALAVVVSAASFRLLPYPESAVMSVLTLGLIPVALSTRWVYVGLERPGIPAAARVTGEVIALVLLLFLVRAPDDIVRVPLAQVAGAAVTAAILLSFLARWGIRPRVELSRELVRAVARRAWPLTMYGLLGLVLYNADLIFLRFTHGVTAVGYYAAAYTLISFLSNMGFTYATTLLPTLSRLSMADGWRQGLYYTAIAHVFALALPAAIGGFVLAPRIIGVIFGEEYAPAIAALGILLWSVPLAAAREVPLVALVASAREDRLLRLNVVTVLCAVALMLVLIPPFGVVGAAWATLGTEAVRLVIALRFAASEGYAPIGAARLWRATLASIAMGALLISLGNVSLWLAIVAGASVYLAALTLLGGIRLRHGVPTLTV